MAQVNNGQLDVWVLERPLVHLAIHLEEGGPDWFGFSDRSTDRPFERIPLYDAVNFYEKPELPLRFRVARFLRQPDVQLSTRDWECWVADLHPLPSI
jgi:hypothetical protein